MSNNWVSGLKPWLNYSRRHVTRVILFGVSSRVAKYASDKQATCPPTRGDKKCFCCLTETFAYLSLRILSVATKFLRWLNWETSRWHECRVRQCHARMSLSLARPMAWVLYDIIVFRFFQQTLSNMLMKLRGWLKSNTLMYKRLSQA